MTGTRWKPGDAVNGHVLGHDRIWHPSPPPPSLPPVALRVEGGSADSALTPVTSIWCGGAALLVSWIPILGLVAWLLAPVGLVFGIIGLRRGKAEHKIMSWLGLGASTIALAVCVVWVILFVIAAGNSDS